MNNKDEQFMYNDGRRLNNRNKNPGTRCTKQIVKNIHRYRDSKITVVDRKE